MGTTKLVEVRKEADNLMPWPFARSVTPIGVSVPEGALVHIAPGDYVDVDVLVAQHNEAERTIRSLQVSVADLITGQRDMLAALELLEGERGTVRANALNKMETDIHKLSNQVKRLTAAGTPNGTDS